MDLNYIKHELEENGYTIIPNVLNESEINEYYNEFHKWYNSIPNLDVIHKKVDPHGIFKHHYISHQSHGWLIRLNQNVQNVFRHLWDTDDLIVSFDGSCYIEKEAKIKIIYGHILIKVHKKVELHCYQSFVSLTTNEERTLVVYEGSHKLHNKYFIDTNNTSNNNWQLIDHEYLDSIKYTKKVLKVNTGSLVIWDSRTFHQNQYGKPHSEERLVQYVCYFPKSHELNTIKLQKNG